MRKVLTIMVLAANIVLHAAPAGVVLKLVRTPHYQFEPGYAILSAKVVPDARNRSYCIVYSGGQEGEQCRELAGADAAPTQPELMLRDIGAGHYTAYVSVARNDGSVIGSNVVEWDVLEPGADIGEPPQN